MKKLIELKGVSRTYGNGDQTRTVLKNVDLTIVAGEWWQSLESLAQANQP